MAQEEQFCSQLARQAGEALAGTATGVKVWFLLEYRAAWRAKAVTDNVLPAQVQAHLAALQTAVSGSRLLFIRQQDRRQARLRFFVVRADEMRPALYEFELDDYVDLTALDLAAVSGGDEAFDGTVREEPLFLVCTNGTRDKCCAKFGMPAYQALRAYRPKMAWQSSHIGGHRYAPTVLFLPQSVNYGFFEVGEAQAAVEAHMRGEIYDLDRYRGRTYYAPVVQAADSFLRRELDLRSLTGIRLRSAEQVEADRWRVQFDAVASGEAHQIDLRQRMTEQPRLVSCSPAAMKPAPLYQLLAHKPV